MALSSHAIFQGKYVQKQPFPEDVIQNETYKSRAVENGKTSDSKADEWLKRAFIPSTVSEDSRERRLLIRDSHGSH